MTANRDRCATAYLDTPALPAPVREAEIEVEVAEEAGARLHEAIIGPRRPVVKTFDDEGG